ncbi:hypothetical protein TELCIR_11225 [Teladorsagia circumcincta]|uniref:Spermidine synthase n=1 Tax=Teladorsagia circumcincta TaxID=45464 RepID=A0A2G9UC34_TELCI|nr:hypothetical protein TELCIR_11225 [Teladorsagia circumcincta]
MDTKPLAVAEFARMYEEFFKSGALDLRHDVTGKVLSIGLGAGYINSFLHHHFPNLNITVIELDPKMLEIAQKWYGFEMDESHRVIIDDGMAFIKKAVENGINNSLSSKALWFSTKGQYVMENKEIQGRHTKV